jgi:hypothetical protein
MRYVLFAVALFSLGFSWSNTRSEKSKTQSRNDTLNSAFEINSKVPPSDSSLVKSAVKSSVKSAQANISTKVFSGKETVKQITVPESIPVTNVPSQLDIQKQLADVMRINANLKKAYINQASEIRRIHEQAKIHQRILQGLDYKRAAIPTLPSIPAKIAPPVVSPGMKNIKSIPSTESVDSKSNELA